MCKLMRDWWMLDKMAGQRGDFRYCRTLKQVKVIVKARSSNHSCCHVKKVNESKVKEVRAVCFKDDYMFGKVRLPLRLNRLGV